MPIVPITPAPAAAPDDEPGEAESYEVGYCKPPRHSRFKTGQSGNPRGRPRGAKGFKTIIRSALLERVRVRTSGGERRVSRAEALVLKTIELASKDNLRAAEKLLGWYQEAVTETSAAGSAPPDGTELSEVDRATLAALRESIAAELASEVEPARGRRS